MSLQITTQDCELFRWINRCGFVTVEQISQAFHRGRIATHKRLRKLTLHHYLNYHRITYESGVYSVTANGVQIAQSPLPPLYKIPLGTYHHHLTTITLLIHLHQHWGGYYHTEREIRHDYGQRNIGLQVHVSDGDFFIADQRIAIEVELSRKGRYRRDKIFHHYLKNIDYNQIWYFYGNAEIKRQLQPYQQQLPWLSLYDLQTVLQHPEVIHVKSSVKE